MVRASPQEVPQGLKGLVLKPPSENMMAHVSGKFLQMVPDIMALTKTSGLPARSPIQGPMKRRAADTIGFLPYAQVSGDVSDSYFSSV